MKSRLGNKFGFSNYSSFALRSDYRPKVLSRFGDRAAELRLDGTAGTATELDMALVMAALRQSEQLRHPTAGAATALNTSR